VDESAKLRSEKTDEGAAAGAAVLGLPGPRTLLPNRFCARSSMAHSGKHIDYRGEMAFEQRAARICR
jgi:hypothetical protein